jgi:hypothetical protein
MNKIEELFEKLKKAPQDKEGAFKISTWVLIVNEIIKIKVALQEFESIKNHVGEINRNIKNIPNVDEIAKEVKSSLQIDLLKEDPKKVLF